MMIVQKAQTLAMKRHQGQKWGLYPYEVHLARVVKKVSLAMERLNFSLEKKEVLLAAAWLHDSVEDTATTTLEISELCGDEVAEIVYRVTDEPGINRKEKKQKTYPKISLSEDSVLLKLCDRIVNVEYSFSEKSSHFLMYKKEHEEMKKMLNLYPRLLFLWEELEDFFAKEI